jgi:hypothetical protein
MSLFWTQFLCSYVCPLTCGAKPHLVPHVSGPSAATSTDVTAEDPVRFFFASAHATSPNIFFEIHFHSTCVHHTLEYIMQPLSVNQTHPKMLPRGKLLYIFEPTPAVPSRNEDGEESERRERQARSGSKDTWIWNSGSSRVGS